MARPTLRRGTKGERVEELQRLLLRLGYDLGSSGADSVFGRTTESAVRAFQKSRGLTVDGVVGPRTWAALCTQAPSRSALPPVPDGISQIRAVSGASSTHTWGVAVDVNGAANKRGTRGDISPGILAIFERHGLKWGGEWRGRNCDPMHFRYCTGY